jgi:hypothetical protein
VVERLDLPDHAVPDLNDEHHSRDYYRYDVRLSSFFCDNQDEWVNDEPYWHITYSVPRFDPDDMEFVYWLSAGELYNTRSRITGSYSIDEGEEKGFRTGDRRIFRANTFNTATTFTVSLWEEDWSKDETRAGLENAIREIRRDLENEIKKAVLAALKEALADSLMAVFDEIAGDILKFFQGSLGFDALMSIVQTTYGGIDSGWLALELIFGGKDLTELLAGWGGACWECTVAILAIKVAGPIVIDLLQGNFEMALKGFLLIPYKLFETVIKFFLDIIKWFKDLMAFLDPDDFIATVSTTIDRSNADVYNDADWDFRHGYGIPLNKADQYYREHGYGPTPDNHSLMRGDRFDVPALKFLKTFSWNGMCAKWGYDTTQPDQKVACQNTFRQLCYVSSPLAMSGLGGMAECEQKIATWDSWAYDETIKVDYTAFYTVKRDRVGGRETFGYTVHPEAESCIQKRTYRARSNDHIKVSVAALNSAEILPVVTVRSVNPKHTGIAASNAYAENIHEFYIEAIRGEEYDVQIWNGIYPGSLYGYVSLEEKEDPTDLRSIKSHNFPDYYIRHRNFLGEISRLESTLDNKDATFRVVPGLADDKHYSFESINYPGYYLYAAEKNSQIRLMKLTGASGGGAEIPDDLPESNLPEGTHPAARGASSSIQDQKILKAATFDIVAGLAGSPGVSFKSLRHSRYFIRHKNFKLYLESGRDNQFKQDATFHLVKPKWPERPR